MDARDRLFAVMTTSCTGCYISNTSANALIDNLLNEHAHELAEKIRGLLPEVANQRASERHKDSFRAGLIVAAIAIDPECDE